MNLAEAQEAAKKARPLLQARSDAKQYLLAAEVVNKEYNDDKLWRQFTDADYKKFASAVNDLQRALIGEKDSFGIRVKEPTPLEEIETVKKTFEDRVNSLPDKLKDHFFDTVNKEGRAEKLEREVSRYENQLLTGKPQPQSKPKPEVKEKEQQAIPYKRPEEPKGTPIEDKTKWPKLEDSDGIKREPAKEDPAEEFRLAEAISEMARMPQQEGKHKQLGNKVDFILELLETDDKPSEEKFIEEAHRILGKYYNVEAVDDKIKKIKEDISQTEDTQSLENELFKLEEHHNLITKMDGNLKFLYQNWKPMDTKSNLYKTIHGHHLILGDKRVTLTTPDMLVASLKFSSSEDACKKFVEINSPEDVEEAFSLSALAAMEKEAADISSIIKPDTKGPSAEEEKPMVTAIVEWMNAKNIQGSEEDVTKKAADYLSSKAPDYDEANIERVARKVFAEWTASKPIPSEVGAAGKPNMGNANSEGTGVFVEPNTGNTNVQNQSPTGAVRKEALLSFRTETTGEVKTASMESYSEEAACKNFTADPASPQYCLTCKWIKDQHPQFKKKEASLYIVAFVAHIPGHKNAQGESAPWVIKSHETDKILSSHTTEAKAKEHLQQMHMFKSMGKEASADLSQIKPAILDPETGEIFTGVSHANVFDNVMKSAASIDVKRRALKSLELENENTGFKDVDGKFITRAQAEEKYGFATSEQLADKINKGASMNAGDIAVLNTQVGVLPEGTEVEVTAISDTEVAFTAGNVLGITKVANLDKTTILKEAGKSDEKYPWDNDGLEYKFALGDRVRVGSIEHNGESWKGEEGTVREKVVLATNGEAERFYLVELDCGGNETLPEESLSKAGKKKEAALNHEEFIKEAVIKPNFDAVQDFLKSYDNPPSVVTTDDIEHWMADEKNNYQYSKKDLKEFVKYLESAHVEVRVPAKKKVPEVLPGEAGEMGNTEAEEAAEFAPPKELKKEAIKYRYQSPDGKQTIEKDVTDDMGPDFETEDPSQPGMKMKWTKSSMEEKAECTECNGVGSNPCTCMDDELWLTTSCDKCNDEGAIPCAACKPK